MDLQGATVAGTSTSVVIAEAVDAPVISSEEQVITGSTVNGFFLSIEAYASSAGALANLYLMVYKNPGGNLTMPEPNVVGSSDNKKYVIHQEMIMMEQKVSGNPRTLFKGVIVVPRHMRRMAPDDEIDIRILSPGVNTFFCMQAHYKEFR